MTCLKKEQNKLAKEIEDLEDTLKALKKHPKILKIQELDVKPLKVNYLIIKD